MLDLCKKKNSDLHISLYSWFSHTTSSLYTDFTYISASNTATDDVTN